MPVGLLLALVSNVPLPPVAPAMAAEGVLRFHLDYVEVREEQGHRLKVPHSVEVTLRGGKQITAAEERGVRHKKRTVTDTALGSSFRQFSDRAREGSWSVDGPDTLVRRSMSGNDTEILVLKVVGHDECKAGVGYVLQHGKSTFERRSGSYERIVAEDVVCRLSRGE